MTEALHAEGLDSLGIDSPLLEGLDKRQTIVVLVISDEIQIRRVAGIMFGKKAKR